MVLQTVFPKLKLHKPVFFFQLSPANVQVFKWSGLLVYGHRDFAK